MSLHSVHTHVPHLHRKMRGCREVHVRAQDNTGVSGGAQSRSPRPRRVSRKSESTEHGQTKKAGDGQAAFLQGPTGRGTGDRRDSCTQQRTYGKVKTAGCTHRSSFPPS